MLVVKNSGTGVYRCLVYMNNEEKERCKWSDLWKCIHGAAMRGDKPSDIRVLSALTKLNMAAPATSIGSLTICLQNKVIMFLSYLDCKYYIILYILSIKVFSIL